MTDTQTQATVGQMPRIGDPAPNFDAVTTQGQINFYDWKKDAWTVFFSHPADFTPVCSTELTEFARRNEEFASRNTKLICVSVDSIHAHLAWRQNLQKITGMTINYPMVADSNMAVSQKYGMIHPGADTTATVRAVFVVDPKNVIRGIIYYPMNVGRNIDEIVRLVDALQTADTYSVAMPVNWKPGEKAIVPAPKTEKDVEDRLSNDSYERLDFYLCKKELKEPARV